MSESLVNLPPVFNQIAYSIKQFASLDNAAELQRQFNAISTYTNLFYSEQEQFATFTKQIQAQFGALNTTLPETREGFRALVDGIKVTSEATNQQFLGLIALAPAADTYYKTLEEATRATNELIASLTDESKFKTMFDFQRFQGLSKNYGAAFAQERIPSYAVGTNYVPNDGLAMLHQGEAVVPAKFNTGGGGDMTALVTEVRDLKAAMQLNTAQAKRAADVLVNITPNGNTIQTEVYVP